MNVWNIATNVSQSLCSTIEKLLVWQIVEKFLKNAAVFKSNKSFAVLAQLFTNASSAENGGLF